MIKRANKGFSSRLSLRVLLMLGTGWFFLVSNFCFAQGSPCDKQLSATAALLKTRIGQWEKSPAFTDLLGHIRQGDRLAFDEGVRLYEWLDDEKMHRRLPPAFQLADLLSPPLVIPALNWIRTAFIGFNRTHLKAQLLRALVEARLTKSYSLESLSPNLQKTLSQTLLHLGTFHLNPVVTSDLSALEVWALIALSIEGDSLLLTEGLFRVEHFHKHFRDREGAPSSQRLSYFVLARGLKHLITALAYHPEPAATLLIVEFLVLGDAFYLDVKNALSQRPEGELSLIEVSDYREDPLWTQAQSIRASIQSPDMSHYINLPLRFGPGLQYLEAILTDNP